ncbi:MAG: hypothetical protein AAGA76_01695 [Pseudomonadota bacterium]
MRVLLVFAFLSAVLLANFQPKASFAIERFPACTSEKVLKKIVKRFNRTERIYWQERGLKLDNVSNPHNHITNPFPYSPINRHYCHGDAHFDNGQSHRIHYLIEQGAGFAGFTWNVEYCIHGVDPWRYYDGRCRVLSRGGH